MKKVISLLLCLLMLAALPISANAMRIQHNVSALNSHRNLTNNVASLTKNLENVSGGFRINRAGDDAAGLTISEQMRAQIAGLEWASAQSVDNERMVSARTWALLDVESDWYYLYEGDEQTPDQGRSDRIQEMWEIESVGYYVNAETEQALDQDDVWMSIEERAGQTGMQLFSGLYGQNNTPQGMFAGVGMPDRLNGIGYEADAEGKLNAAYQIVLTEEQQIIVNDNPRVALANTRGDVIFYEAGTVNIGIFDAAGNAVDSFSIQVNEDGTLATASYANQITLQLGDTGTFQMAFEEEADSAEKQEEPASDRRITEEMLQYAQNSIIRNRSAQMMNQASQVPQAVLQMQQ